ncbi:MAG: transposase [Alphaproteobacteria bacterium]|jgi:transposase
MRRQFDGLAAMVRNQLLLEAHLGNWFVFINRKRTHMKVLYYHQGGYCLWAKRLERGTFAKLESADSKISLKSAQLQCLIDGIFWQKCRRKRRLK